MDLESIYLDYNATSPLSQSVINWLKSGDLLFANPSSQHSFGKASRKVINETRTQLFSIFGKNEKNTKLFFHSGATEAMTTVAWSFSEMARKKGHQLLICTSRTDHPCVEGLSQRFFGPHVKFLELKKDKDLRPLHAENFEIIKDKKENDPDLIILYHHLWVHNETGLVSPLEELRKLKSIGDLYVHVDAVQAVAKVPQWKELAEGDFWTFSAHKFGALKGIGFTFFNIEIPFYSLLSGGGQQQNLRSGTENTQGIRSIGLALADLVAVDVKQVQKLKFMLQKFLQDELTGIGEVLTLGENETNSNTVYFYFNKLSSDIALALFDLNGLQISAGSACSSGASKASEVLLHRGQGDVAKNGLRLSFSFNLGPLEYQKIVDQIKIVIDKVKSSSI